MGGLDAVLRALDRSGAVIAPRPPGTIASPLMGATLNSLHLVVLGALFVGADDAGEIGARLGLDVDDVAVLLAELERAGAIVTDDER